VLNRAARESGNPVPDIVENLPQDLAIWIDPGEVSYRIGKQSEKGSVKILYSESLDGSYLQNNYNGSDADSNSSPEAAAVAAATAAAMAAAASCQQNKFQGNFLPLDNLNLAMGGLTLNTNSPPAAAAVAAANVASQAPPPTVAPPSKPQQQQQQHSPQLPMNGGTSGAGSTGFAPFQPPRPPHQPITYTAGTFAQTKFGSTKLKSNAKKTNRMSPTEFSNYIKQRAMQKQGGTGPQQPPVPVQPQPQQPSVSANTNSSSALMPIGNPTAAPASVVQSSGNAGYQRNNFNNSNRGFHGGNLNYGGGSGRIPPHQNQDPYFYPLFPDRGQNGSSNFFPSQQQQQPQQIQQPHQQSQPQTLLGCNNSSSSSSGSSSASSSASSSGSNPWSFGDADAELFLQDILTVGLSSKAGQSKFQDFGGNSDLGLSGISMLNNLGGLGSFGLNGSGNHASSGHTGSLFGLDESGNSGVVNGSGGVVNNGSMKSSNGSSNASGSTNSQQQPQQRVLVAN